MGIVCVIRQWVTVLLQVQTEDQRFKATSLETLRYMVASGYGYYFIATVSYVKPLVKIALFNI